MGERYYKVTRYLAGDTCGVSAVGLVEGADRPRAARARRAKADFMATVVFRLSKEGNSRIQGCRRNGARKEGKVVKRRMRLNFDQHDAAPKF